MSLLDVCVLKGWALIKDPKQTSLEEDVLVRLSKQGALQKTLEIVLMYENKTFSGTECVIALLV